MAKIVKVPDWIVRVGILPSDISIAIAPYIFLNSSLYQDYITGQPNWFTQSMIEHETAHIERQQQFGVILWLWRYITSNSFCFQEEIIALKREMDVYRQNKNNLVPTRKRDCFQSFGYTMAVYRTLTPNACWMVFGIKNNDKIPPLNTAVFYMPFWYTTNTMSGMEMSTPMSPEKFMFQVSIATPNDWQECKRVRELAITGDDASMFNATPESVAFEQAKTEEEWKTDLSSNERFYVLSRSGGEAIGMGRATEIKSLGEGTWGIFNGYVRPEFRGNHVAQEMFVTRLREIQNRGGKFVVTYIHEDNEKQMNLIKKFGFEKYGENPAEADQFVRFGLDLSRPIDFSSIE